MKKLTIHLTFRFGSDFQEKTWGKLFTTTFEQIAKFFKKSHKSNQATIVYDESSNDEEPTVYCPNTW